MPIDHNNEIIFVHIPKTMGTSIVDAFGHRNLKYNIGPFESNHDCKVHILFGIIKTSLLKNNIFSENQEFKALQHLTIKQIKDIVPENIFNKYYKFSIVRDPFTKTLSDYNYLPKSSLLGKKYGDSFSEYILKVKDIVLNRKFEENIAYDHLIPQHEFLYIDEKLCVDKVFKFENAEEILKFVKNTYNIKLKCLNTGKYGKDDILQINSYKNIIYDIYRKDFILFKYEGLNVSVRSIGREIVSEKSFLTTVEPTVDIIECGYITPAKRISNDCENQKIFTGGIYHNDLTLYTKSIRRGNRLMYISPVNILSEFDLEINEPSLYLGYILDHYGHFLIESIGRFWFCPDIPQDVKYLIFHMPINSNPKKYQLEDFRIMDIINHILESFDLKKFRIIIVNEKIKFKKLYIPEQLSSLVALSPLQDNVYSRIIEYSVKNYTNKSYQYIYISRRMNCNFRDAGIDNEEEIERIFESKEFKIINPSKFSFEDQVSIYNNCKIMAGIEGSGLHNCMFMKKNNYIIELSSRRWKNINPIQNRLNLLKNLNVYIIPFKKSNILLHLDTKYVENTLNEYMEDIMKSSFPDKFSLH